MESFKFYLEFDLDVENFGKEEEIGSDIFGFDVFELVLIIVEVIVMVVLDEFRILEWEVLVISNFIFLEENLKLSFFIWSNSE